MQITWNGPASPKWWKGTFKFCSSSVEPAVQNTLCWEEDFWNVLLRTSLPLDHHATLSKWIIITNSLEISRQEEGQMKCCLCRQPRLDCHVISSWLSRAELCLERTLSLERVLYEKCWLELNYCFWSVDFFINWYSISVTGFEKSF